MIVLFEISFNRRRAYILRNLSFRYWMEVVQRTMSTSDSMRCFDSKMSICSGDTCRCDHYSKKNEFESTRGYDY